MNRPLVLKLLIAAILAFRYQYRSSYSTVYSNNLLLPLSGMNIHARYFDCHCCRCSTTHDFTRGIRCPRCYKGTVYPPTQDLQRRPSKYIDRKSAVDASACTACDRVPTRGWLTSAMRAEQRVGLEVNTCLEDFGRLNKEVQTMPTEEKRHLEMALTHCSAVRVSSDIEVCSIMCLHVLRNEKASQSPPCCLFLTLQYLLRFEVISV